MKTLKHKWFLFSVFGMLSALYGTPAFADYVLTAVHSEKCLADPRGNMNPNVPLIQATCNGNPNQRWDIEPSGLVRSTKSGLCMAVSKGSSKEGATIVQTTCTGAPPELWEMNPIGDITYQLISRQSGQCLSVKAESTKHKAAIVQHPCGDALSQMWVVTRSSQVGSAATPPSVEETDIDRASRLIVGAWQSESDPSSIERYEAAGSYTSIYGRSVAGSGTYQVSGECGPGMTLTVKLSGEATPYCYFISEIGEDHLALTFSGRGNTLTFRRYNP